MTEQLDSLITEFQNFFKDRVNDNKNEIVRAFADRNFDVINPLMQKNEKLHQSGFQQAIGLAKTVI